MRKAEYRTYKNKTYFLWQNAAGWVFFIRDLEKGSEVFENKEDAMAEARKQIEIAVLEKKFKNR
jgi:hypothetical protein